MLRRSAIEIADELDIGYDSELEDVADELIGFPTRWVQDKRNQTVMLESFFSAIQPERSLSFFYAKQTPLSDAQSRVLVGVGRIARLGGITEYRYTNDGGQLRSILWERNVTHSIRAGFRDGFLLPYHDLLEAGSADRAFDMERFVAFAPDDHWLDYSYGTEHVSHDAGIASLLACERALRASAEVVDGPWRPCLRWIDERLNEIWQMRGPCPGLGSALSAFGLEHGHLIAYELAKLLDENEDPWPLVDKMFAEPASLRSAFAREVGPTFRQVWASLPEERRRLLELLSRFDLTTAQATRMYQPTERKAARIETTDLALLENPYRMYEVDRHSEDPIGVGAIDRGVFPPDVIEHNHPLSRPSRLEDAVDPRRVRGLVVSVLEGASEQGHTIRPRDDVVQALRDMPLDPSCPAGADLMPMVEDAFDPEVYRSAAGEGVFRPASI
jgi:hypothetical protein